MKKKSLISQIFLNSAFILLCIVFITPFLFLISISLSNEADIAAYGYKLIPMQIDFSAYKYLFTNPQQIISAYKVTIAYSVLGTFLVVLITALGAYPLSKKNLPFRSQITFYFYFTMLFGGGLIPTYILNTQYLHMNDSFWIYIFPALVSPWNLFMMRTFLQAIPTEIAESATIDGASEYRIFLQIILPLAKPVLATVAFLTFLGKWNDWYTSLLYIDNEKLISLQYLLQRILQNIALIEESTNKGMVLVGESIKIPTESVRMAISIVVAGPALIVFPFFQKYFTKGLTIGSVKG